MSERGPFQDVIVRVEALALARGGRLLFENLSFTGAAGDYIEIGGANGSGKTSLLRALAGFLRPYAGKARIEAADEPSLALHYVGHLNALKGAATVRDHLRYWAGLFGGRLDEARTLETLDLTRAAEAPARVLSQGQARRLALARLLIAHRPVWLLDEPAAGLDAAGRAMLADMIRGHCAQGGVTIAAAHEPLGPAPARALVLGAA